MSFDPTLLLGATGIGGSIIAPYLIGKRQINSQESINERNIQVDNERIAQQRQWALEDWDKVNAYNAPSQQMQRYLDAGLNPNLIYGNAQNSPSAMVRNTNMPTSHLDSQGISRGYENIGQAFSGAATTAMNAYFANKQLENDTMLKSAQVLNLKSQSDKTSLDNALTRRQFNELALNATVNNELKRSQISLNEQKGKNMMSSAQANRVNEALVLRSEAQAKHAQKLFELADKEGKLKQADLDTLEALSTSPTGLRYIIQLLSIILNNRTK